MYHPQTNGQCEGFNSSLISMLETLPVQRKLHWKDHLATLVHVYNCTRSIVTSFSAYFLMFGRYPRLAQDVAFGVNFADMASINTEKCMQN